MMKRFLLFIAAVFVLAQGQAAAQFPGMPRVNRDSLNALTNADHAQMLGQLGLTGVRPGRDAYSDDPAKAPNYDEMKANPWIYYPDPLVTFDGRKVKDAKMWRKVRRPELALFPRFLRQVRRQEIGRRLLIPDPARQRSPSEIPAELLYGHSCGHRVAANSSPPPIRTDPAETRRRHSSCASEAPSATPSPSSLSDAWTTQSPPAPSGPRAWYDRLFPSTCRLPGVRSGWHEDLST